MRKYTNVSKHHSVSLLFESNALEGLEPESDAVTLWVDFLVVS